MAPSWQEEGVGVGPCAMGRSWRHHGSWRTDAAPGRTSWVAWLHPRLWRLPGALGRRGRVNVLAAGDLGPWDGADYGPGLLWPRVTRVEGSGAG